MSDDTERDDDWMSLSDDEFAARIEAEANASDTPDQPIVEPVDLSTLDALLVFAERRTQLIYTPPAEPDAVWPAVLAGDPR